MKGGRDGASTGEVDLERGLQSQRDALVLGELASVEIQARQMSKLADKSSEVSHDQ